MSRTLDQDRLQSKQLTGAVDIIVMKHFQNTFSGHALFHSLVCEMILGMDKPEDHWSCIAPLGAEDMLKPGHIEEKTFKNIESE